MCEYCEPIHKFEEYDSDIEERWRTVMATKAIYGFDDGEKKSLRNLDKRRYTLCRINISIRIICNETLLLDGRYILVLGNMEHSLDRTAFLLGLILLSITFILGQ